MRRSGGMTCEGVSMPIWSKGVGAGARAERAEDGADRGGGVADLQADIALQLLGELVDDAAAKVDFDGQPLIGCDLLLRDGLAEEFLGDAVAGGRLVHRA